MFPKSRFSKPIFGHSAVSTKLDRPHCKQFWKKKKCKVSQASSKYRIANMAYFSKRSSLSPVRDTGSARKRQKWGFRIDPPKTGALLVKGFKTTKNQTGRPSKTKVCQERGPLVTPSRVPSGNVPHGHVSTWLELMSTPSSSLPLAFPIANLSASLLALAFAVFLGLPLRGLTLGGGPLSVVACSFLRQSSVCCKHLPFSVLSCAPQTQKALPD